MHFQQDKTTFNVHYTMLISRQKYKLTNYCKLTSFCISPSRMLFSFKNSKNTETNLKGMVTTGFSHDRWHVETVISFHIWFEHQDVLLQVSVCFLTAWFVSLAEHLLLPRGKHSGERTNSSITSSGKDCRW